MRRSFFKSLKDRKDFHELGRLSQETTSINVLQGDAGVLVSVTLNGKCRIRLCVGRLSADMIESGLPAMESSYVFVNTEAQEEDIEACCKILNVSKESLFIIIRQMELWARKKFKVKHSIVCSGESALWEVISK